MNIDSEEVVEEHTREIKRRMIDQASPVLVNEIERQIELAHQTPGPTGAALFDRFVEVMRTSGEYDRVVFDTSPTWRTLRLYSLPGHLGQWLSRLGVPGTFEVVTAAPKPSPTLLPSPENNRLCPPACSSAWPMTITSGRAGICTRQ